ncbi:RNA binding motif protein 19 [Phyllostomus discolor]|uniref:RNA binding motif protein 19 n=1 Tax=Phyllostomus discolor TaxID=89673 RepID=A0A833Z0M2_9CHIR|nr:RNA binding motif protein 19 [Phyllostomus discolor]
MSGACTVVIRQPDGARLSWEVLPQQWSGRAGLWGRPPRRLCCGEEAAAPHSSLLGGRAHELRRCARQVSLGPEAGLRVCGTGGWAGAQWSHPAEVSADALCCLSPLPLQRAFSALCHSTHLYGRRLVLEWADSEVTLQALRRKTAERFHEPPKKKRSAVLDEILEQLEDSENDSEERTLQLRAGTERGC